MTEAERKNIDARLDRLLTAAATAIDVVLDADNAKTASPVLYVLVLLSETGRVGLASDAPKEAARAAMLSCADRVTT